MPFNFQSCALTTSSASSNDESRLLLDTLGLYSSACCTLFCTALCGEGHKSATACRGRARVTMYARREPVCLDMRMDLRLFENLQLECSYVGDLLHSLLLSVVWTQ